MTGSNASNLYGSNSSNIINPYYFPDPHGLSFFDRLENRTNNTSPSPNSAQMSTFIIYDVLSTEHGNNPTSMMDHEYFNGVPGSSITSKGSVVIVQVQVMLSLFHQLMQLILVLILLILKEISYKCF